MSPLYSRSLSHLLGYMAKQNTTTSLTRSGARSSAGVEGGGGQGTREKDGATRTFPRTINLHTFSNTNLDQLIGLLSSKGDEGRSRGRGSKRSFSLFGPREGVTDAGGNFVEKIETFDGENTMKPEVGSWGAAENFGNRLAITNRIRVN